jgi:hypothetical protein
MIAARGKNLYSGIPNGSEWMGMEGNARIAFPPLLAPVQNYVFLSIA